jgi:uncharacterized membrane protein
MSFELFWTYVVVFLLGAIPFIEAIIVIPIAILAGLHSVPVTMLAFLGNFATVLLLIVFIEAIKLWRSRRKREASSEETNESKRTLRARRIWDQFGLPGLAIIGTFIVGSHLTAFLMVTFGGTKRLSFIWMTISLVLWSVVMGIISHFGIDYFFGPDRDSFIMRFFENSSYNE